MGERAALFYSDEFLTYDFGRSHPLNPVRLLLTYTLMMELGLFKAKGVSIEECEHATEADIMRVHTSKFIDAVKAASEGNLPRSPFVRGEFGLGYGDNPIFNGMYEASSLYVGASLRAARLIAEDKLDHAFNISGGLHHATEDRASGFCIFNDPAIAIKFLREHFERIMYIDIDAHHGDGVQRIFYDDPSVLTVSLHESGDYLFPGTGGVGEIGEGEGEGYAINVPFPRYTTDDPYLYAFREVVPPLADGFEPQIIVTQLGADAHFADPLTDLSLTTRAYDEIGEILHKVAHNICDGRWLGLGGGGYDMTVVPRAWSIFFGKMVGSDPPDEIPMSWVKFCEDTIHKRPSSRLLDQKQVKNDPAVFEEVEGIVEEVKAMHRNFFG